jgi:hypothetical protein
MNLHLMDTNLIVLGAVAIAIIAVLAMLGWIYLRKRKNTTAGLRKQIWVRVRSGGAGARVRTKSRGEIGGSREAG